MFSPAETGILRVRIRLVRAFFRVDAAEQKQNAGAKDGGYAAADQEPYVLFPVQPILDENKDVLGVKAEINV